jgi:hypothetical protein
VEHEGKSWKPKHIYEDSINVYLGKKYCMRVYIEFKYSGHDLVGGGAVVNTLMNLWDELTRDIS